MFKMIVYIIATQDDNFRSRSDIYDSTVSSLLKNTYRVLTNVTIIGPDTGFVVDNARFVQHKGCCIYEQWLQGVTESPASTYYVLSINENVYNFFDRELIYTYEKNFPDGVGCLSTKKNGSEFLISGATFGKVGAKLREQYLFLKMKQPCPKLAFLELFTHNKIVVRELRELINLPNI